jgi:hypothetical protein
VLLNTRWVHTSIGAGIVVLAVAALPACSSIGPAAVVDGEPVSAPFLVRGQAEDAEHAIIGVASEAAEQLEASGASDAEVERSYGDVAPPEGTFDAAVLQSTIGTALIRRELAERGVPVTDDDVGRAQEQVLSDPDLGGQLELSDLLLDAAVEARAVQIALGRSLVADGEVAGDTAAEVDQGAEQAVTAWLTTALREADVQVDPAFGTWDVDAGRVVPPAGDGSTTAFDLFRPELAGVSS